MASFYWVGGTGAWATLSNWRTLSGGSTTPAALPTTADWCIFDGNSGASGSQITINSSSTPGIIVIGGCSGLSFIGTAASFATAASQPIYYEGGTFSFSHTGSFTAPGGFNTSRTFTASCSGTTLTVSGTNYLAVGTTVLSSTGVSLGTITSMTSITSYQVSVGGTYASQTMSVKASSGTLTFANTTSCSLGVMTFASTGANITLSNATTATLTSLSVTGSAGTLTFSNTTTLALGTVTFASTGANVTASNGSSLTVTSVSVTGSGGTLSLTNSTTQTWGGAITFTSTGSNLTIGGTNLSGITNITASSGATGGTCTFQNAGTLAITGLFSYASTAAIFNFTSAVTTITMSAISPLAITGTAANVTFDNTTLTFSGSGNVNANSCAINCATVSFTNGAYTLTGNLVVQNTFTGVSAATLAMGAFSVTCKTCTFNAGLTATSGVLNITGTSGAVFVPGAAFQYTGTINLTATPAAGTTRTITGNTNVTVQYSMNITGGSDNIIITTSNPFNNLNFTGFTGTLDATSVVNFIYGNLTLGAGMTIPDAATAFTFTAASATKTITSNGVALNRVINISGGGVGASQTLADDLTTSRGFTLTSYGLNINGKTLTCSTFNSNNANSRTLAWGTNGKIKTTGSGTVYNIADVTALTATGSGILELSGSTGSTTAINTGPATGSQRPSLLVTGNGTYLLQTSPTIGGAELNDVDFSGFAGTLQALSPINIYGNLTLSSAMTITSSAVATSHNFNFYATTGVKTITTNGKAIPRYAVFSGTGGSWQILGDLTISQPVTHNIGTIDLNGYTTTFSTYATGTGTKNLTFNGGAIVVTGSGVTAFNNAVPTGFSTTAGTAKGLIYMTATAAKTFVGGGSTYNATLVQSGPLTGGAAGALTISGANTFSSIKANTLPCTINFPASTTTTFADAFQLKGTNGSNVTIGSSTAGTVATVARGSSYLVSTDFLTLTDNTASQSLGGTWYAGGHSTINARVTGWTNSAPPTANTEFLVFLQ